LSHFVAKPAISIRRFMLSGVSAQFGKRLPSRKATPHLFQNTVVQMTKSAKDFDVFRTEPWHRQADYGKQKSRSDFSLRRCANLNCCF